MRRQLPGYIYVLDLTDGVTKVGYSAAPAGRLSKIAGDIKLDDREILRHWISPRHAEASVNEGTLIGACERLGGVHYGPDKAREWFTGLRFEDVVAVAGSLPFTACGKKDGISVEAARAKLGDLVNDAQNGMPVLITRSGKPAAMLVPVDRFGVVERDVIARTRKITAIPAGDNTMNPFEQLGYLKHLAGYLADALERLGGPPPDEEENP